MGRSKPGEDVDSGRVVSGEGKGPVCDHTGVRFGVVEWIVGEYQSDDGILHGRDGSFGVTGHGRRNDVHRAADL